MNIHWKIFTNTNTSEKTAKVLNHLFKQITDKHKDLNTESYHKGGFISTFSTSLIASQWPDAILESLKKAQLLGRSYVPTGDIESELDACSNETTVSGITNIHLVISNNA